MTIKRRYRHISILLFSLVLATVLPNWVVGVASSSGGWSRTYGGEAQDRAYCAVQTSDGGYAIAGYTTSMGHPEFWLVKTDASGNAQWNRTYGTQGTHYGSSDDWGHSVVQTSDGGYAIAGEAYAYSTKNYDLWLVKTDASGNKQWSKSCGGAGNEHGGSVVQTVDGGYAIAGYTDAGGTGNAFWLEKVDANGNLKWNKAYLGTDCPNERACSIARTSDGGFAIAGKEGVWENGIFSGDFWLVKTDANGNVQLDRTYGGIGNDCARSVIQTADGGYALAGSTSSYGVGADDFWLIKTDSGGNAQWNKTCGGTDVDCAYSLVQTSDGGYALAGSTRSFGAGGYDFWLVKTDASGNKQWSKSYGEGDTEQPGSVVQTTDNGYAMAGCTDSSGAGKYDFWLVKTDNDGSIPEFSLIGLSLIMTIMLVIFLISRPKVKCWRRQGARENRLKPESILLFILD